MDKRTTLNRAVPNKTSLRIERTPIGVIVNFCAAEGLHQVEALSYVIDIDRDSDLIAGIEIIGYARLVFGSRHALHVRETIPDSATWDSDSDCLYVKLNRDRTQIPFRQVIDEGIRCRLITGKNLVLSSIQLELPPAWQYLNI